jgi:predicted cupin superfamily sugar epimerase
VLSVDADHPQALVPAGVWQRTLPGTADALVSCLVSPGFDFEDFTLA